MWTQSLRPSCVAPWTAARQAPLVHGILQARILVQVLRNSRKGNRRLSLHSCDFPALGKVTKGVMQAPMEQEQKKMGETTQTCSSDRRDVRNKLVKNPLANAGDTGDMGLIPGMGRSPGEGNGNPLQSCLENPMDRGAWLAKNTPANAGDTGDMGSVPGLGRSPGGGHGDRKSTRLNSSHKHRSRMPSSA